MQQSCSRARIRVTQCESERGARARGREPIQCVRRFVVRAFMPFGIPLIPLNPAESRIAFKFCPSGMAEPDRDGGEIAG